MSEFLFDIPEVKSPRLIWMEKHGITTNNNGRNYEPGDECPESGEQLYPWLATTGAFYDGIYSNHNTGWGFTEDESITQLALKLGIKLWNEEVESPMPNLIEAGDINNGTDVIRYALLIECASKGQLQKALRTGTVSFTVFESEMEGGRS